MGETGLVSSEPHSADSVKLLDLFFLSKIVLTHSWEPSLQLPQNILVAQMWHFSTIWLRNTNIAKIRL